MYLKTSNQKELSLGFQNYRCNWGVHICGLYESDMERDQIIMGFLHQGVQDGDLQLFAHADDDDSKFKHHYCACFDGNCDELEDPTRFQIYDAATLYYPNGHFSPWDMDEGLNRFYIESQKDGPRNVRATADMAWALQAVPGVEHLMVYESRLNYFIPDKPWISICMYNVNKFSGSMIMQVLRTHPYSISGGVLTQNPFYQDPDQWLKENAPEFLNQPEK